MVLEVAVSIAAPVMGYLIKRQLEINKQVDRNTAAITDLKEDTTYVRDRVDKILDNLLNR